MADPGVKVMDRVRDLSEHVSCPICSTAFSSEADCNALTAPCTHTLCRLCLRQLIAMPSAHQRVCPMDRTPLPRSLEQCVRTRALEQVAASLKTMCKTMSRYPMFTRESAKDVFVQVLSYDELQQAYRRHPSSGSGTCEDQQRSEPAVATELDITADMSALGLAGHSGSVQSAVLPSAPPLQVEDCPSIVVRGVTISEFAPATRQPTGTTTAAQQPTTPAASLTAAQQSNPPPSEPVMDASMSLARRRKQRLAAIMNGSR